MSDMLRTSIQLLKPWFTIPLLVGVLGVIVSVALWQTMAAYEDRTVESQSDAEAERYIDGVGDEIREALDAVRELSALYAASETVTRDEFQSFAAAELTSHESIQALEWIPLVLGPQRDAYEDAARGDGFPQYEINERSVQGELVRAGERDEYFPVHFVEPYEGNELAFGFDLGSEATRLEALNRARDSGEITVTGRITLVQEKGDQFGFLGFVPIYRKEGSADTVAERRVNLEGFVLGVYRMGDIVAAAVADLGPATVDVALFDDSAPPEDGFLAASIAGISDNTGAGEQISQMQDDQSGAYQHATISVGGRQWKVVAAPTGAFVASRRTWAPTVALVASLIVTALFMAYVVADGRRRQSKKALRKSEKQYLDLFDNATDLIQSFTADGSIVYANRTWREALGYSEKEVDSLNMLDIIHPDSKTHCIEAFRKVIGGKRVDNVKALFVSKDGRSIWVEGSGSPILVNGRIVATRGIFRNVTALKQAEENVKHMAYHDVLTDLPNRMAFKERLAREMVRARRDEEPLAVMFLDLDRFQIINDVAGYREGDRLLRVVGEELEGLVGESDTVARLGGDEFALLLHSEAGDAATIAEAILQAFRRPRILKGHEFHITASVGIVMYPSAGQDADSLLRNADIAMFRAKQEGRNNCQFYTPAMNAQITERLALENDLQHAMERGEFEVYYQPQLNIRTGQIVAIEALVRWHRYGHELVSPTEFIPVIEETGLIVPLGEWVLRTACAQTKTWQEEGHPEIRIAVNLSTRQFQQSNLVDVVTRVLQETGLNPHFLQLEITEGLAIQDVDFTTTVLRRLRDLGVEIALDDFGTGYSSLSYLQHLPIDVIKLDQAFVHDVTRDPNNATIVRTVIAMAHGLELTVIAEGVETEEQLAFLKEQGCDEMQGYLLSKPVPAEALTTILRQQEPLRLRVSVRRKGELPVGSGNDEETA